MSAKKPAGPYDHLDDLNLLLRYLKLCQDMEKFFDAPRWMGEDVSFEKSQAHAVKIDKVVAECYVRGLMGPGGQESKLPVEDRQRIVALCLRDQAAGTHNANVPEYPWGEFLTPKAKALRPWAHESIKDQWHDWISYNIAEEAEKTGKTKDQVYEEWKPKLLKHNEEVWVKKKS